MFSQTSAQHVVMCKLTVSHNTCGDRTFFFEDHIRSEDWLRGEALTSAFLICSNWSGPKNPSQARPNDEKKSQFFFRRFVGYFRRLVGCFRRFKFCKICKKLQKLQKKTFEVFAWVWQILLRDGWTLCTHLRGNSALLHCHKLSTLVELLSS